MKIFKKKKLFFMNIFHEVVHTKCPFHEVSGTKWAPTKWAFHEVGSAKWSTRNGIPRSGKDPSGPPIISSHRYLFHT